VKQTRGEHRGNSDGRQVQTGELLAAVRVEECDELDHGDYE